MSNKLEVLIYKAGEVERFNFAVSSIKEVFSLLKLHKEEDFVKELMEGECKYLVASKDDLENIVPLVNETIFSDLTGFDTLYILPKLDGEAPAGFAAAAAAAMGATGATATVLAYAITAAVMIAVSVAMSMVMSLLSPTPEFSKDPSKQQQSNLFNGAPIIRDQGGSVPLIFGNPYCGAVLISSGLTTEESK